MGLKKGQRRGVRGDDGFGLCSSLLQLVGVVDAGDGFVVNNEDPLAGKGRVFSPPSLNRI